jgi:hypothetical protein
MPFRLLEHLLSFDKDAFMAMISVRTSCGAVMQELGGARHRFEYATNLPEELVAEIMNQGHRRDRAKLFAALIGPVPMRRRDRSIAVHRYGEIIEVLQPLKYFQSVGFVLDTKDLEVDGGCERYPGRTCGQKA